MPVRKTTISPVANKVREGRACSRRPFGLFMRSPIKSLTTKTTGAHGGDVPVKEEMLFLANHRRDKSRCY